MKRTQLFSLVILALFIMLISSFNYGQNRETKTESVPVNKNMFTPEQWIEDINYAVKRLEITHPDLYANVSREKFNKFADELRSKAKASSDVNMYIGIMELVAMVKDGHTWISWGNGALKSLLHSTPFSLYMFYDGLFVVTAMDKYKSLIGKKIVKVGNASTEEFMKRRARIKTAENKTGELSPIDLYLEELQYLNIIEPGEKIRITFEDKNGIREEVEIEPVLPKVYFQPLNPLKNGSKNSMNGNSVNPVPLWISSLDSNGRVKDRYWYKYLPEWEAVYMQINECVNKNEEPFDKFYQRMFKTLDGKKAKRLIIDLRNNSGGDHYEKPLLIGIIERPDINKSDNLFLITGRRTFSAAQHFVMQLTQYTNVTTFGEPTAARPNYFGAVQGFSLANSRIYVSVSTKLWQDSSPDDFRPLTEPDFYVPLSSTDYRENHDPVLEQIFKYNSYEDLRPEFLEKMSKAYSDGGIEKLKMVYADIKPAYTKYGFNMENLLYKDLDVWMSNNKKSDEGYIAFLRFLRQELPNSIDVCWDLAYWLNKPENKEERIYLYKKCLEINPAHYLAKMRLDLIELEEAQSKAKNK